jgi:hypothetical protein
LSSISSQPRCLTTARPSDQSEGQSDKLDGDHLPGGLLNVIIFALSDIESESVVHLTYRWEFSDMLNVNME